MARSRGGSDAFSDSSGEVLKIIEELELQPYLNRIMCEVTERPGFDFPWRAGEGRLKIGGFVEVTPRLIKG
jgi:hypothetical protein